MDILYHGRSCNASFAAHIGLLLVLCLKPALGSAKPLGQHVRRASDSGGGSVSPKIWIPVLLGALLLSGAAMMKCTRRTLSIGFTSMGEAAAIAAGMARPSVSSTIAAREVTAEQLAGRPSTGSAAPSGRRSGRRTRRTLSQISTKSLPAYMEEPGEQELVIFRGQNPEENANITTTGLMPSVAEDVEGQIRSTGVSQTSLYGNSMSLIHGDESFDATSTRHLIPTAPSMDTMHGSEESASSLLRAVQQAGNDPRGEAPPYFEVVDNSNGGPRQGVSSADRTSHLRLAHSSTAETQAGDNRNSRRLSGFRSMLHTLTNPNARPAIPPVPQEPPRNSPGHHRAESGFTITSLTSQETYQPRDRGASRASHRPSHSTSSTMMQTALRTLSRQKSHQTLNSDHFNSPSMISLNSISAPLTHTLTRTEISYPASGPTADQVRLISSRESFARFGVPYGPDAIAYAASTSRHDLEPPPDFESHVSSTATATRSSPLAGLNGESSTSPAEARIASHDTPSQNIQKPPIQTDRDVEQNSDGDQSLLVVTSPSQLQDVEPSPSTPVPPTPSTQATTPSVSPPSVFRASPPSAAPMRSESRASSMTSAMSYTTATEHMYDTMTPGTRTPESPSTPRRTSFDTYEDTDATISQRITPVTTQFAA